MNRELLPVLSGKNLNKAETWKLLVPYCWEGNLTFGNEIYPFTSDYIFLVGDEGVPHLTATNPLDYRLYDLDLHFLSRVSTEQSDFLWLLRQKLHCIPVTEGQRQEILHLLEKIPENHGLFGEDILRNMGFLSVILYLVPLCPWQEEAKKTMVAKHVGQGRVVPILDYIQENLAEPLCLDEISAKFFISKHYLCRLFKRATGVSVMEYIIQSRVDLACHYLKQGYSVQRAGELSGFSDNSHFIRTFGRITGDSPGKYGKNALQNQAQEGFSSER